MIIAMAGQPNSGKSTIFNHVAGYKTITANFPGKTVEYTESKITINGEVHTIVDLPGTYSLTSLDPAELETRKYLLRREANVTVNVIDASLLARSLELSIQLNELHVPHIVALNMIDEARKKGIVIDQDALSRELGVPVVESIANKGIGINDVLRTAVDEGRRNRPPPQLKYSKHVEDKITALVPDIRYLAERHNLPARLVAIKLLEQDEYYDSLIEDERVRDKVARMRESLELDHGQPSDIVISSERHAMALNLFERVATVRKSERTMSQKIDDVLMHPIIGYVALGAILLGMFNLVFSVGALLEEPLLSAISTGIKPHIVGLVPEGLPTMLVSGIVDGIAGGIGIVLPYLVPFLVALSLLEDVGYLPRIAFLVDTFLHKIGLHGKSILPLILGYGCSVPAIMGARILESHRDRFIVITLTAMVPCAARITVILALVGFYLGANWALFVFIVNIIVLAIVGYILSRLMPERAPGMMLEIPKYHVPSAKVVLFKTWFRVKEFIVVAWPIIIVGSVVLSLLEHYELVTYINTAVSPVTILLGLPIAVGTTLIFGIFRKELAMIMLFQALGTENVISVLSKTQIMTFTMFIIFYVPCIAAIGVMVRELGKRDTTFAIAIGFIVAIVVGLIVRMVGLFV